LPGAEQMQYVRRLLESRPMPDRVPDQSVVKENNLTAPERIQATRGKDYIFIYTAKGKSITVLPGKISGNTLHAFWYSPINGKTTDIGKVPNNKENTFTPSSTGYGHDWVLVLDDADKNYAMP